MSKIWYCANCGYEVSSRGRCHLCRERLVASSLPELPAGEDDDEVGRGEGEAAEMGALTTRGGKQRARKQQRDHEASDAEQDLGSEQSLDVGLIHTADVAGGPEGFVDLVKALREEERQAADAKK